MKKLKQIDLTNQQKKCVEYDSGDLLIKGIAGSGKSVILLKRIQQLLNTKADDNTQIAFLTYTNVLIDYSEDIIDHYFDNSNQILISTVDKYLFSIFREIAFKLKYSANTKFMSYYEFKIKEILKNLGYDEEFRKKITTKFLIEEIEWLLGKDIKTVDEYLDSGRSGRGSQIRLSKIEKKQIFRVYDILLAYFNDIKEIPFSMVPNLIYRNIEKVPKSKILDYLLIDEAQDLSLIKLKVLKELTMKNITIAADHAQKIYNTSFTWKEVGINVRGRASKSLDETFRSTKQIIALANSMLVNNKELLNGGEYTEPILPRYVGPKPILNKYINKSNHDKGLAKTLEELSNGSKTVGILYRSKKTKNEIVKTLKNRNIDFKYIAKSTKKYPKEWNLLKSGINLVTMHSSKGLEFDVVIIPYLNNGVIPLDLNIDEEAIEDYLERERSLLYVSMTRAREELLMFSYSPHSRFINEFQMDLLELN